MKDKKMTELSKEIIDAKIQLSGSDEVEIPFEIEKENDDDDDEEEEEEADDYKLTLEEFEEANEEIIERIFPPIERVLTSANLTKEEINQIILVGGSSNMQFVKKRLKEFFGKEPFNGINPREAVVYGACIFGAIKKKNEDIPEWAKSIELKDICPFSIGTSVNTKRKMEILINKGEQIPVSKTVQFTTLYYRQEEFVVDVLESENSNSNEYKTIGCFTIKNLPDEEDFLTFNVTFSLDESGILSATAQHEKYELKGSIDIDITKIENINAGRFEDEDEDETNYKIFFENLINFIDINKIEIQKLCPKAPVKYHHDEAKKKLENYTEYQDLDINNYALFIRETFKNYFNKYQVPFFLR